jgi:hypothetical protein
MTGELATGKGWGSLKGSYREGKPRGRRTGFGRSESLDLIRRWTVTSDPFPSLTNVGYWGFRK